jgi:hypothetical protein
MEGGPYHIDGVVTNWLKIKNPAYSQMAGRADLFERRGQHPKRIAPTGLASPVFALR